LCWSQYGIPDSLEVYDKSYPFTDGIYVKLADFRENNPVQRSQILTTADPSAPDFYERVFDQSSFRFLTGDGSYANVYTDIVFGVCINGRPYVQANREFHRLVIIGSLCTFATSPQAGASSGPRVGLGFGTFGVGGGVGFDVAPQNTEPVQYVLDIETGKTMELTYRSLPDFLEKDPPLFEEYKALKKRDQKDRFIQFVHTYNSRNPLLLPRQP